MATVHGPALPPDDDVWTRWEPQQVGNPKKAAPIGVIIAVVATGIAVLVGVRILLATERPYPISPTESVYALPGEVTVDPSLPDALPLPEGIWDEVEPGWVLVDYMPVVTGFSDDPQGPILEHTKHVVYLISPDGTRYQVAEFDPYFWFEIKAWTAGETVANISFCDRLGYCDWNEKALLDLETGDILGVDAPWGGADTEFNSTLQDGTRLWGLQGHGGGFLETGGEGNRSWTEIDYRWATIYAGAASPDGNYLALPTWHDYSPGPVDGGDTSEVLIMSLKDGEETKTPMLGGTWECIPRDWLAPTRLALRCGPNDGAGIGYYIYDLTTGELTPGAEGHYNDDYSPRDELWGPYVRRDLQVDYGVYAGSYFNAPADGMDQGEPCRIGIDNHGELTCVVLLDPAGDRLGLIEFETHVGGLLYILANASSYGEAGETIVVYDIDTGSQRILIGPPTAGPTVGWDMDDDEDEGANAYAVLSWAVAH